MNINIDLSKVGPSKLEELVLHVTAMSERDPRFMSTKLNKLVWAADFESFCCTGRTISGANYQREKYGPVPKAMPIVLRELKQNGRIDLKQVKVGTKTGTRPIAKAKPNLGAFSHQELATIDKVIAENFGKTGTDLSRETHTRIAWKVSENGDLLPFTAWFISERSPTTKERQVGIALEEKAKAFQHGKS